MSGSPPLRFLVIVLGGWVALRTALIAPPWSTPPVGAAAVQSPSRAMPGRTREVGRVQANAVAKGRVTAAAEIRPPGRESRRRPHPALVAPRRGPPSIMSLARLTVVTAAVSPFSPPTVALPPRPDPATPSTRRWSLAAWSFARRGGAAPLATGGLLGGSQAGARLSYRLNRDSARPLALSLRLSSPLRSEAGAEAALGLDWKPIERLPVHLLAERRQALGKEGRSAFGLTAFGGIGDAPLGRFRLDAYAQAGVVGARSRDLFVDGSIRLSLPLDRNLRVGAGAWAAAQPGLARLDFGPQAALRLPVAGRAVTLAADWRLRTAGNAAPDSGPTVTLSTEF